MAALGDLIVTAAVVSPYLVRSQMRMAAYEYERASRAPAARQMEGQARHLYRESTQTLTRSASSVGRNDTAAALGFLVALVTAVDASRRWHQAQDFRVQADAAGRAGRLLHEAVEVSVGANAARDYKPRPKRAGARKGTGRRAGMTPEARPMIGTVQEALPAHAGEILADPAWPALRARLVEVEEAGEDPGEVLAAVAARRELGSADSVAEVLVWRLYGWQRQRGSSADVSGSDTTAAPAERHWADRPGAHEGNALADATAAGRGAGTQGPEAGPLTRGEQER